MNFLTKLFSPKKAQSYRALDIIMSSCSLHPSTGHLVKVLPDLTNSLYAAAKMTAKVMSDIIAGMSSDHRRLLTECILDLELVSAFDEVVEYTNDFELASYYIDAILFQATGKEPSDIPTEKQYMSEGTQLCRGIAKYKNAKAYFNVPDRDGWLFGKEYSAILTGRAQDIAYIASVRPMTDSILTEGRRRTRYALTGKVPS